MSAAPQMKEALKFEIEIVKGPHIGFKNSYTKNSVTIGRGPENDIVLSGDPRVSRQHAEIKQRGTEFVIVNLSQKNFVMVNNQSIQSEIITNDSVILIGDTEIRLKAEVPAPVVATPPPPVMQSVPPIPPLSSSPVSPPSMFQGVAPVAQSQSTAPQVKPFHQQMPANPAMGGMPGPVQYGGYQGPQMGAPGMAAPRPAAAGGGLLSNPRVRFYGIIGVVAVVGFWFFTSGPKGEKKDPNAIRTSAISMQDVADAEKRSQELLTIKRDKYDSVQYRRAQENFVKGFRDFQQGQYARAREAFQVVLNLDQDNELAKRYFHLSKIKFDELVKFNMIQGNRYREKRNWRMCQSNYSNVMTMLQQRKDDPTYKEAKQFFDECTLNLEGRF